jgi:hypothetical protein
MWVDYDVPNLFPTLKHFYQSLFSKWLPQGINSGHHNLPTYEMSLKSDNVEFVRHCCGHFENGDRKFDMWVDNDVLNGFATLKNFYRSPFLKWPPRYCTNSTAMSEINSGHHYLPTYQILMISDNVEFLRYCGGHFENGTSKWIMIET